MAVSFHPLVSSSWRTFRPASLSFPLSIRQTHSSSSRTSPILAGLWI